MFTLKLKHVLYLECFLFLLFLELFALFVVDFLLGLYSKTRMKAVGTFEPTAGPHLCFRFVFKIILFEGKRNVTF